MVTVFEVIHSKVYGETTVKIKVTDIERLKADDSIYKLDIFKPLISRSLRLVILKNHFPDLNISPNIDTKNFFTLNCNDFSNMWLQI